MRQLAWSSQGRWLFFSRLCWVVCVRSECRDLILIAVLIDLSTLGVLSATIARPKKAFAAQTAEFITKGWLVWFFPGLPAYRTAYLCPHKCYYAPTVWKSVSSSVRYSQDLRLTGKSINFSRLVCFSFFFEFFWDSPLPDYFFWAEGGHFCDAIYAVDCADACCFLWVLAYEDVHIERRRQCLMDLWAGRKLAVFLLKGIDPSFDAVGAADRLLAVFWAWSASRS